MASLFRPSPCTACGTCTGFRRYTCPDCKTAGLCYQCADFPVLEFADDKKLTCMVRCLCKACFRRTSTLDLNRSVDVYGPAAGEAPSIVFVHGGGGSRTMFRLHATILAEKHGLRCVCLDLPGHGGLMDSPLSTDTAVERIAEVTREHTLPFNGKLPLYVGGSLGGYLGMELMARSDLGALFSEAFIMCASQTTGVGRGYKAGAGLAVMNVMTNNAKKSMLTFLASAAKASKFLLHDATFADTIETGMFFNQAEAQIRILRESNPLVGVATFKGPIVFMLGDQDYRDNQENLERAAEGRTTTVVYKGGDHFFTHDSRFLDNIVQRIAAQATAA